MILRVCGLEEDTDCEEAGKWGRDSSSMCISAKGIDKSAGMAVSVGFIMTEYKYGSDERASIPSSSSSRTLSCPDCCGFMTAVGATILVLDSIVFDLQVKKYFSFFSNVQFSLRKV